MSFLTAYIYSTSAKIIKLNEWGYRDRMHHAKNHGNKEVPLAILSRILAQSCVSLHPHSFRFLPHKYYFAYLRATIINGYKFWRLWKVVDLAGINFSHFDIL